MYGPWACLTRHILYTDNCFNLLSSIMEGVLKPDENGLSYASLSCPSLIMSILQYCPDCKQHAQFVETLMRYKSNVCLDILAVLAYGPQPVINSAGQVLLHYYPLKDVGMFGHYETPFTNYACRFQDKDRLQVVPHFSSGIVEWAKCERARKSPHARRRYFLPPVSPFLVWGDFHAHSRFVRSTIPDEKWGTTLSLRQGRLRGQNFFHD